MEDEDDMPVLPSDTLAALQEFYVEKDVQEKRFEDLKAAAKGASQLSMNMFSEDWNSSQFWYSDETAIILAKQLLNGATNETSIAVVSAPSVFIQLKNLLASEAYSISPKLHLLEYDDRFSVFKEFVRYDFNKPLSLPTEFKGQVDRLICDPPFLSMDCQTKAALTARWLSKPYTKTEECSEEMQIIVCTGERMEDLIRRLYPGVRTTTFEPQHGQSRLSNEFRCFANHECDAWQWR